MVGMNRPLDYTNLDEPKFVSFKVPAPDRATRLRAIPDRWGNPPKDMLAKLPKGGDKNKDNWKTCRLCGGWHATNAVHLDYMGHADVTLALIDVDPEWSWEPMAFEEGLPAVTVAHGEASLWIYLTVCGKRLPAVGTCSATKDDMFKELIGDALRNGAMRFGIGTKLWSKTDGDGIAPQEAVTVTPPPDSRPTPPGVDARAEAARRGREAAEAAVAAASPPPAPAETPEPVPQALPAETMLRLEKLQKATPKLNPNQRKVRLARLARTIGQEPDELSVMVANDLIWGRAHTEFPELVEA